jgi:hypothetical protein
MSYFVPSALVAGQARFMEAFTKGEWRIPSHVAFDVANKGAITNPLLQDLRTREDRTVYAYFPIRQAAINGTARAAAHTGARGDSIQETLTWSTFSEPFSISIKQADNNVFSFAEMYAATMRNAVLNLISRADAWFVAAAVADKTQVNNGGGNGSFNATDDNYENPLAEMNYFFQNARAMMEFNELGGALTMIADSKAYVLAQRLMEQGSANATNYGFQFMDTTVLGTNRTILGSTFGGSALVFPDGLVAAVPWIPKQNRKPLDPVKALEYNGDYGQIEIPELPGIPIAIHAYAERADNGSYGGYTQDLTLQVELSIDLAYASSPLSTFRGSNDSVVYTVGQLTA